MIEVIRGKTQRFQHVFFDLDGTVTESGPGILNALHYMMERAGIREEDETRLNSFIGPPVTKQLKKLYGFTEAQAQEAYAFYREYYTQKGMYESRLYDGITAALEEIRRSGKRVYLATAKPEFLAIPILKHFGITGLFDRVFSVRREEGIFDKLQVLEDAARTLGRIPGPVMVGDRSYDIEGGRAVGYATAGVLYGYGGREELIAAGCDYLLDSVEDLTAFLGGMDEGTVYRV
jgi:phosphoglycolate phosphatase